MGVVHAKVYSSSADPVDGTDWNADHVDGNGNSAPTWAVDANNRVTGLIGPDGYDRPVTHSYRTVLFGDSMTQTYQTITVPTDASYNTSTGLMTVTYAGHQMPTGMYVSIWNRGYASLLQKQRLAITRIDANTYSVQMAAGLSGLPNGSLSGTTQVLQENLTSMQGFITFLQAASGWRFNIVWNGAQSGDTTQNALDRIDADCLAYEPNVIFCQMPGINDMGSANGPVQEETIWDNQQLIVDRLCGSGAQVVLLTMTPVASGEARGTLQNMAKVQRLNARLAAYCMTKPGVTLFDAYSQIVDPTDTTGLATTGLLRSADDIHYSQRGAKKVGQALWTAIQHKFPSYRSSLPVSAIDCYTTSAVSLTSVSRTSNVISATGTSHGFLVGETAKVTGGSEPLNEFVTILTAPTSNTMTFASTGSNGSITGTIYLSRNNNLYDAPTLATVTGGTVVAPVTGTAASKIRVQNYAGTPGVVASVVANADGFGNDQKVVITPGAANDQVSVGFDFGQYSTQLPTVVKAARTYYAEAYVTLTDVSGSNLSETRFNLAVTVGGVIYQTYALNGYENDTALNTDWSGHVRTAPMTLPSGSVTKVNAELILTFSAAGTAITAQMGRIALREVEGE